MSLADVFKNKKALITFITCADPDLDTTEEIILSMERAGADLIELGIPFSDPTAEGPVIQAANMRALANGVTTDKIFEMVRNIKDRVSVPLVFMTYANVVFSYGIDEFFKEASIAGISGIILPDIPLEEKNEFSDVCNHYNMEFISLIAPTSKDRISTISKQAEGFIYCVSSLGVTGTRNKVNNDFETMIAEIRQNTNLPIAVGFGIANKEQASYIASKSDGVIIGSAIVKIIEEYGNESAPQVYEFVKSIRNELDKL